MKFETRVIHAGPGPDPHFGDVSPAIHTLATKQFDDFVKRVRVFVHPNLADDARQIADVGTLVEEGLRGME